MKEVIKDQLASARKSQNDETKKQIEDDVKKLEEALKDFQKQKQETQSQIVALEKRLKNLTEKAENALNRASSASSRCRKTEIKTAEDIKSLKRDMEKFLESLDEKIGNAVTKTQNKKGDCKQEMKDLMKQEIDELKKATQQQIQKSAEETQQSLQGMISTLHQLLPYQQSDQQQSETQVLGQVLPRGELIVLRKELTEIKEMLARQQEETMRNNESIRKDMRDKFTEQAKIIERQLSGQRQGHSVTRRRYSFGSTPTSTDSTHTSSDSTLPPLTEVLQTRRIITSTNTSTNSSSSSSGTSLRPQHRPQSSTGRLRGGLTTRSTIDMRRYSLDNSDIHQQ